MNFLDVKLKILNFEYYWASSISSSSSVSSSFISSNSFRISISIQSDLLHLPLPLRWKDLSWEKYSFLISIILALNLAFSSSHLLLKTYKYFSSWLFHTLVKLKETKSCYLKFFHISLIIACLSLPVRFGLEVFTPGAVILL